MGEFSHTSIGGPGQTAGYRLQVYVSFTSLLLVIDSIEPKQSLRDMQLVAGNAKCLIYSWRLAHSLVKRELTYEQIFSVCFRENVYDSHIDILATRRR